MDVVEMGGMRLHLLPCFPGLPGEGDRVIRMLQRLGPAVILGDVDTADALRIRAALAAKKPYEPPFIDQLFLDDVHRRYAPDVPPGEHPLVAAARYARDRHAEFVPLRATHKRPGFFARSRAKRALKRIDPKMPEDHPAAFVRVLAEANVWKADDEIEAAHRRLVNALGQGRAPIVAVLQAHRQALFEDAVLRTGRIPA